MGRKRYVNLTPKKEDEFFQQLEELGTITAAADAVNISRQHIYWLKKNRKRFAKRLEAAQDVVADKLEARAIKRALGADSEDKGSHVLLIFLLKGLRPDRYGVSRHEHSGPGGKAIPIARYDRIMLPNKDPMPSQPGEVSG